MTPNSLLILTGGYLVLCALLIASLAHSPWHWLSKAALVSIALGSAIGAWYLLQAEAGKPAQPPLPASFQLLHSTIIEPSVHNNHAGAIYLWIQDLAPENAVPRSFALAYERALHDKIRSAQNADAPQRGHYQAKANNVDRAGGQLHFETVQRPHLPAKK